MTAMFNPFRQVTDREIEPSAGMVAEYDFRNATEPFSEVPTTSNDTEYALSLLEFVSTAAQDSPPVRLTRAKIGLV